MKKKIKAKKKYCRHNWDLEHCCSECTGHEICTKCDKER